MTDQAPWLTPAELRLRIRTHALRLSDIPIESYVSLPLPSLRWHSPAYAIWVGPKVRRSQNVLAVGAPTQWWVLSAKAGQTNVFARYSALPFGSDDLPASATIDMPIDSRDVLARVEETLAELAMAFFSGTLTSREVRQKFLDAFNEHVPADLSPWYRALTPDFFAWLEA
jgi:hypothetical protein